VRKKGTRRRSSETEAETELATTLSVAKEATTASAGDNGPAPMEGVERTNAVVVRGLGSGQNTGAPLRQDPYTMEIDRGRNCYACGEFGHMACHCRN